MSRLGAHVPFCRGIQARQNGSPQAARRTFSLAPAAKTTPVPLPSGYAQRGSIKRGELAFAPALRERVALLKGLPARVIDDVLAQRIVPTPGGRTLVATMRANGAYTCLVSGGFTAFAEKIAQRIGFDEASANQLLIDASGMLLGEVAEPILGREAKLATLLALRARLGLAAEDTLAIGDGANDLDMIRAAGLGIAFHAKPAVAAAAAARIDHCDLTAVLFIQGYRRDQFVE